MQHIQSGELSNPDQELDSRASGGIVVRLMLRPEGTTYVTADDQQLGKFDSVDVPSPDKAYDVFHHPYSYLAEAGGVAIGGSCPDYLPDQKAA